MKRRSPVWILACCLALVTSLTHLSLSALAAEAPSWPVPAGDSTHDARVRAFSDAVNRTLRSGDATGHAATLESLQLAQIDVPSAALQSLSLAHTTVAPGSSFDEWTGLGPEAISLETGQLTVVITSGSVGWRSTSDGSRTEEWVYAGDETTLEPGDLLLLPEDLRATVRNDELIGATFLAIALRKPGGSIASASTPGAEPSVAPAGVTTTALAGGPLITLPSGPARLSLGRAALAPRASFPVESPGAASFVVETGTLDPAEVDGAIWSRLAKDGTITTDTDHILGPGDAVMVGPGSSGTLRNAGDTPLFLRVVTITPDLVEGL